MKAVGCCAVFARLVVSALLWQGGREPVSAADAPPPPPTAFLVAPLTKTDFLRHSDNPIWDHASADSGDIVLRVGDQVRTLENGRATIRLGEKSLVHLDQLTTVQIIAPRSSSARHGFNIMRGLLYMLHREEPGDLEVQTLAVNAAVEGTDFAISVEEDGTTTIALIDGRVQMSNAAGTITLVSGEKGMARPGQRPTKTALIDAVNSVQWSLYYPGVLDPDELRLDASSSFATSLAAYRKGDLVPAFALCPANIDATNSGERLYRAALLLSAGQVTNCESLLQAEPNNPMTTALRYVIAAVKRGQIDGATTNASPSQCLGYSYYAQSRHDLEGALKAAQQAVSLSPHFAFAWERVAELQFSFGRAGAAQAALNRSLELAPNNAQAHTLRGFLLAADNRIPEAVAAFGVAVNLDGNLANAWLGRGLCRIKQGETRAGFQDLETAAVLEPTRSLLRSYLGKALSNSGDDRRGEEELQLARRLDANDPTPWLYLALMKQQENQINAAIDDLQNAQTNNDNRSLFRSRLLLDQDRAVGSANLAAIYHDAGMTDVSVREAARAVTEDYANASAHLFLADAYDDLRDPTQFNLRYETAWFNELLLANALAPAGGGRLSQEVSQQEYSKLLSSDGLNLAGTADARSDGMYHEQASQYGTFADSSYALDLDYRHNNGVRVNNSLDDLQWNTTVKQQITPRDTALLLAQYENYHSGDNFQYYYQTNARPNFHFSDLQDPDLVAIWHHEWGPGMHTLAMAGRFDDDNYASDKAVPELYILQTPAFIGKPGFNLAYHDSFEIYSGEVNQICEWDRVTLSAGVRYQNGTFRTQDHLDPTSFGTSSSDSARATFDRFCGYSYLTVQPLDRMWLTAGLASDQVQYPDNFRNPPVASGEDTRRQLGPKAALVWNPVPAVTVRGDYTHSLGGVSLDESYRLEPTQLAGFPQAFRSLIAESAVGSVAAPAYQTLGLALDFKLGPGTYAGLQAERLATDLRRTLGVFNAPSAASSAPGSTPNQLDYVEHDFSLNLNQLLGGGMAAGINGKLTQSRLHDVLPLIPVSELPAADLREHSWLESAGAYLLFNHPSGFFARAETQWYHQHNSGFTPAEPGDDFFQENLFAGWNFAHRKVQLRVGLLNLGGHDYKLEPLTQYQELPRKRVLEGRFSFLF
jgi:Tfp pilus assembly protein PilF